MPEAAYIMITHTDGTKCIWLDGEFFVPLDAGGEGYTCPKEHPWMPEPEWEYGVRHVPSREIVLTGMTQEEALLYVGEHAYISYTAVKRPSRGEWQEL